MSGKAVLKVPALSAVEEWAAVSGGGGGGGGRQLAGQLPAGLRWLDYLPANLGGEKVSRDERRRPQQVESFAREPLPHLALLVPLSSTSEPLQRLTETRGSRQAPARVWLQSSSQWSRRSGPSAALLAPQCSRSPHSDANWALKGQQWRGRLWGGSGSSGGSGRMRRQALRQLRQVTTRYEARSARIENGVSGLHSLEGVGHQPDACASSLGGGARRAAASPIGQCRGRRCDNQLVHRCICVGVNGGPQRRPGAAGSERDSFPAK